MDKLVDSIAENYKHMSIVELAELLTKELGVPITKSMCHNYVYKIKQMFQRAIMNETDPVRKQNLEDFYQSSFVKHRSIKYGIRDGVDKLIDQINTE